MKLFRQASSWIWLSVVLSREALTSTAFTPQSTLRASSISPSSTTYPTYLESINVPDLNGAELARPSRRTVYSHEDWKRHRSPERFYRNLSTITDSAVASNVAKEVLTTTSFATFLVFWNIIFGQYEDLEYISHTGPLKDVLPTLSLPLSVFTLASPSLGLLLAYRVNKAYSRWDEARKNWGMNINHTRDLVRMGNAYYDRTAVHPDDAQEDLDRLALCTWAFVRSMKRHLSPEWEDEEAFRNEMLEKLPQEQAEAIFNAAHRPNRALQDLSTAIENLPMHSIRRNEMQHALTIFEDNLGSSERLLTSPMPTFYSKLTARSLSVWLWALPLGLWGAYDNTWNHAPLIPSTFLLSLFLFGVEEVSTQLEEPFTVLPMQAFCDKMYNWCNEIASFEPGDNGMPVYIYDNSQLNTGPGMAPEAYLPSRTVTSIAEVAVGVAGASAQTLTKTQPAPAVAYAASVAQTQPAPAVAYAASGDQTLTQTRPSPAVAYAASGDQTLAQTQPAPSAVYAAYDGVRASSSIDQYTLQYAQSLKAGGNAPLPTPSPAAALEVPSSEIAPATSLSPYELYRQSLELDDSSSGAGTIAVAQATIEVAPSVVPQPQSSSTAALTISSAQISPVETPSQNQALEGPPQQIAPTETPYQPTAVTRTAPVDQFALQYAQMMMTSTMSASTAAPIKPLPAPVPPVSRSNFGSNPGPGTNPSDNYSNKSQFEGSTTSTFTTESTTNNPPVQTVATHLSPSMSPMELYAQSLKSGGSSSYAARQSLPTEVQVTSQPTPSLISPMDNYAQSLTCGGQSSQATTVNANMRPEPVVSQAPPSPSPAPVDQYALQYAQVMRTSASAATATPSTFGNANPDLNAVYEYRHSTNSGDMTTSTISTTSSSSSSLSSMEKYAQSLKHGGSLQYAS
eukprot:CAMPEP_0194082458 /NCGR_PEP_ID=MMETSP0149-20130528/7965_1 /TAXON_ID=122233 /ORGANISM="Chaetoceros debilis, Strain MM31A-1" /LENGTH=906 /DNA_ID=CAMNT_0038764617 /DNA_START=32 /DNA_END=2752 /DNA_ORIENTATION=-